MLQRVVAKPFALLASIAADAFTARHAAEVTATEQAQSPCTHYVEQVRDNKFVQAFLAGVSAAVVGVIAVISLDLVREALSIRRQAADAAAIT